jgi:K+/H+ antiporter YhaU regulatory subunit KhtT
MPRRDSPFRQPLTLIENDESFVVKSASGQNLAYVYSEDEPGQRTVTKRITREDARRFATAISRLPDLMDELRKLRAGRDDPA